MVSLQEYLVWFYESINVFYYYSTDHILIQGPSMRILKLVSRTLNDIWCDIVALIVIHLALLGLYVFMFYNLSSLPAALNLKSLYHSSYSTNSNHSLPLSPNA